MANNDTFLAVAQRVVPGGRLLRCWPLKGGVSASMHALEISVPDAQTRRVVVRRHGAADFKPLAAGVTASEFLLLKALRRLGMLVPEAYFFDESGDVFSAPYLVMDFVEGTTIVNEEALPGALRQMAAYLARLHALELGSAELPELRNLEDPLEGVLNYLPPDAFGQQVRLALAKGDSPGAASGLCKQRSLVHGDFWPGNLLWQQGQLVAVLDWEDAALGDPLADLACARVELLCKYDEAAMETFTAHYLTLSKVDLASLPLWELYVSASALATMVHWGLDPEDEARRRRRTEGFMQRAGREWLARKS